MGETPHHENVRGLNCSGGGVAVAGVLPLADGDAALVPAGT